MVTIVSIVLMQLYHMCSVQVSRSVMFDSATPWTAARQTSLSITNSGSLLKLMSIELGMPSNHHQLLKSTQTHVHRVGDAIRPSHPLSSPSPPAPNPSQHQGLFQ